MKDLWTHRARRMKWRANAGWWVQRFIPGAAVGCVVSAILLLAVRSMGRGVTATLGILAIWLLVSAFYAWRKARPKFLSMDDALSRLDMLEGLNNRLVSAAQGVGEWPPVTPSASLYVRWNIRRILLPLGASACVLLLAAFIPLQSAVSPPPPVLQEPTAWKAIDAAVELLREEEWIREDALDRIAAQVEALRQQPQDQWYRQHSMEASDHLRQQVGVAARELQHAVERAAVALALAEQGRTALSPAEQSALHDLLRDALNAMEGGLLQLDESLLNALKDIDLSQLTQLTDGQLAELERKLAEAGECLNACASACGVAGGAGPDGDGASGLAGITEGPGSAPLTLHSRTRLSGPEDPFAVGNEDMSRAALGDRIALSEDTHEVDTSHYLGATDAGAVASPGGGGEAVWRVSVTPREQRLLRGYFE